MKLGTWDTFDCPTKKEERALAWLRDKVGAIGGQVRRIMNPHDFGPYPSFEIDKPFKFEGFDEDFIDEDNSEEVKLADEYDDWIENINEIYEKYSKRFEKYL